MMKRTNGKGRGLVAWALVVAICSNYNAYKGCSGIVRV